MPLHKHIFTNTLILSFGIFIGRLSGYLREVIIAYKFGVNSQADAIILMLNIPDLLNNLLISGAISAILLPMFSKETNLSGIITEFTRKLFILSLTMYIVVGALLFIYYEYYLFGLLSISLLSVFPNVITFVSSSYLQYKKKFTFQALNTLVFNLVIILFLLFEFYGYIFAFGVIMASVIRMFWITYDLNTTDINSRIFFNTLKQNNPQKKFAYQFLIFMILANGIAFINPMVDKLFAAFLQEGSVAVLSYAEKIYLLPVSIFLTTYAIAMFPDLSKMVANRQYTEVNALLKRSIYFNLFISLIVAVFIYIFSDSIVKLLYGIVGISVDNLSLISYVLNGYFFAIVFAGFNSIVLNLFFSFRWYNLMICYSILILTLKILGNWIIVYLDLHVFYIALSTSLLVALSALTLITTYFFRRGTIN